MPIILFVSSFTIDVIIYTHQQSHDTTIAAFSSLDVRYLIIYFEIDISATPTSHDASVPFDMIFFRFIGFGRYAAFSHFTYDLCDK
jgi:hypothetical protein